MILNTTRKLLPVLCLCLLAGVAAAQEKPTPTPTPAEGSTLDAWRKALPATGEQPPAAMPAVPEADTEETPEQSEKRLTALEHRWLTALAKRDVPVLQAILGDDFLATAPDAPATLANKAAYLKQIASLKQSEPLQLERLVVRLYDSMAVIHVWLKPPGDNNPVRLLTDVWLRRGAQWQAIARHY